jgi:hypothetical protein
MGTFLYFSLMTVTVRPSDGYFAALYQDGRVLPQPPDEMGDPASIPVVAVEYTIVETEVGAEQTGFFGLWHEQQQVWEIFNERSEHHSFAILGSHHHKACEVVRKHYGDELPKRRPKHGLTLTLWAGTVMRAQTAEGQPEDTTKAEGYRGLASDDVMALVQRYADLAKVRDGQAPASSVVLFRSLIGEYKSAAH